WRYTLETGRQVRRFAQSQGGLARAHHDRADDHRTRVNANAEAQRLQAPWRVEMGYGRDQCQAGAHSPERGIFVGLWITKVDQEPSLEILRERAAVAGDNLRTLRIVGLQHGLPVLRIALTGQHGGINQITQHDSELPPLPKRGAGA